MTAHHGAAGVHEDHAVALELLHDEAFATEEARPQLALKGDAQAHAARCAQKTVALADQLAADIIQVDRQDLAGIGRGEGELSLLARLVLINRGEQRLAGQQPFASADELAEQPAAPSCSAGTAVAKDRVQRDAVFHVHQAAGFADHCFARVEFDLHELHLMTFDPVIDHVHRHVLLRWFCGAADCSQSL